MKRTIELEDHEISAFAEAIEALGVLSDINQDNGEDSLAEEQLDAYGAGKAALKRIYASY
jgi:hypothetical protein